MKCPNCQFQNPEEMQFCVECGAKLEVSCPKCRFNNSPDFRFCGKCGYNLGEHSDTLSIEYSEPQSYTPKFLADKILTTRSSIEGERKLVTVLFADVANYTSMAEKLDPEDVHQIMDGCFKILINEIHRYEGTINQFTGDGVMALFGAPLAHEDHAQRACRTSFAIQKALTPYGESLRSGNGIDFKMRIGLNSGPVVVASIGDDLRMDYTAVGDTTNLAARMEAMAKPGTVLASHNTYKFARDFFEFKPLGKVWLKGKKDPQEAYEIQSASEIETRIDAAAAKGLSKFVGRRREIQDLQEAFEKTCSGSGQVLGVAGEAGVGKSRLLIEFRNMLHGGNYTYHEGRCLNYGGSMAYLPVLDVLRSYFNINAEDSEFNIKTKIESKTLHLDERLRDVLSPLYDLLSLKIEDGAYLRLEPGIKRLRTFEAVRDLFVRESQNRCLVLAVEDLHWIDKTSEEFLSYLIESLADSQNLLILLYRPEYIHQWEIKSHYSKISIDQLSRVNSSNLVEAILEGGWIAPELGELILSKSGGNPLFMEEFIQSLLEKGSIQRKDRQYILRQSSSEIDVPDTIQGIIAARIDRLEECLKQIMQVASVIGREFAFRVLQNIGIKKELKSSLLKLQGQGFISEKTILPEQKYIFKHALIQEVAYNSLLRKKKKELHEKIGKTIEEIYPKRIEEYYELLAHHYAQSDNIDKAVEYLSLSNKKGIKLNAMEEVRLYFNKAMQLYDNLTDSEATRLRRVSLLVNQRDVFLLTAKFPDYHELLIRHESLAASVDHNGLLGAFYERLGACNWWSGNFKEVIRIDTRAADLCEAAGNDEDAAYAYMAMAHSHYQMGDFDQALIMKEKSLKKLDQHFNFRCYGFLLMVAPFVYSYLGRWEEAVKEGRKVISVGEEYSNDTFISCGAWCISMAYSYKGDFAKAVKYAEFSVRKAPNPTDKLWAQQTLALALYRSSELTNGIELIKSQIALFHAVGYPWSEIQSCMWLSEAFLMNGENDKARQALIDGLKLAERCGTKFYIAMGHRLMGELDLKIDPSKASTHFEQCIAICRKIKAENELGLAYAGYGRLYKEKGSIPRAQEYLKKSLDIFERLGTLIEPDKVRKELEDCLKHEDFV